MREGEAGGRRRGSRERRLDERLGSKLERVERALAPAQGRDGRRPKQWRPPGERGVLSRLPGGKLGAWVAAPLVLGMLAALVAALAYSPNNDFAAPVIVLFVLALGALLEGVKPRPRPVSPRRLPVPRASGQRPVVRDRPAPPSVDPIRARTEELCASIVREIRTGPSVVRDFLDAPEQSIRAVRKAARELLRRELRLREIAAPEETDRLERERAALASRLADERDPETRRALTPALAALDAKLGKHREHLVMAGRLEAERTRLQYTLENLEAQLVSCRVAAESGPGEQEAAALESSLERLSDEVDAIASALEEVNRNEPDLELEDAADSFVEEQPAPEKVGPDQNDAPAIGGETPPDPAKSLGKRPGG